MVLDKEHENHDHDMEYLHGHTHAHNHATEHMHGHDVHNHDAEYIHEQQKFVDILQIIESSSLTGTCKKTSDGYFFGSGGCRSKSTWRAKKSGVFS